MLTLEGWIHGLFNTFSVFFGSALGLSLLYRSKKKELKTLTLSSFLILSAALAIVTAVVDFFTILVTGTNITYITYFYLLIFISLPLATVTSITSWYIGAELLIPSKKKIIIFAYIIMVIIFYLFLIFNFESSLSFLFPLNPGDDIWLFTLKPDSIAFILLIFSEIMIMVFLGFGFLYKGIRSAGLLRKKFILLSIAFILYSGGWIFYYIFTNLPFPFYVTIPKTMWVINFILWYYGFKEETPKLKKKDITIEIKQAESQSRFIKILAEGKPSDISEEEIIYSREQQICIVCKGEELGFTYICPECKTLYCENCARSISNLENACWVCNAPIDKSKPAKLEKREKEEVIVKDSKKTPKEPKINK